MWPPHFQRPYSDWADEITASAYGVKAGAINVRSCIGQCKGDSHIASRNGPEEVHHCERDQRSYQLGGPSGLCAHTAHIFFPALGL